MQTANESKLTAIRRKITVETEDLARGRYRIYTVANLIFNLGGPSFKSFASACCPAPRGAEFLSPLAFEKSPRLQPWTFLPASRRSSVRDERTLPSLRDFSILSDILPSLERLGHFGARLFEPQYAQTTERHGQF
jgi:hypothetical protein